MDNNIRKIYLVDTENVGSEWIYILNSLNKRDRVILFHTINSKGMRYNELKLITQIDNPNLEFIECQIGKSALDLQLVSYLGYLIKTAPKTHYIIMSDDSDYQPVVKFWNESGYNVTLRNIRNKKYIEKNNSKNISDILDKCDIPKNYQTGVMLVLQKYNVSQSGKIHNELNTRFPEFERGSLYGKIKPEIINLYKYITT